MRRIARTVAASIVVILGLALVSVAAFSSDIVTATLPEAPTSSSEQRAEVDPLDPNADNGPVRKVPLGDAPDIFKTEFGERGKHEVTVTMSGNGFYHVQWRGGKSEDGAGTYNRTRTVKGGFPLAFVGINGAGNAVSCTITIDGVERDKQTTSAKEPIVFCQG
jgi:hypothetical protein